MVFILPVISAHLSHICFRKYLTFVLSGIQAVWGILCGFWLLQLFALLFYATFTLLSLTFYVSARKAFSLHKKFLTFWHPEKSQIFRGFRRRTEL